MGRLLNSKRNRISIAVVVAFLVIAVAAWYFFLKGDRHREIVPSDATAVAVIDLRTLVKQAQIDPSKFRNVDNNTGVDFAQPIYAFVTANGSLAFTAAISDCAKLENNMRNIRKRSGYTYGTLGSFVACHDGDCLLAMGPLATLSDEALLDEMDALMNNVDTKDSPILVEAELTPQAFTVVAKGSALPQIARKQLSTFIPKGVSIADIKFHLDGQPKSDRLTFTASVHSSQVGVDNIFGEFLSTLKPISTDLINTTPQDPAVWLCAGIKGEKLLNLLRRNDHVRGALLALNMCIDADMMIKATDGDVCATLPRISLRQPVWMLQTEMKDTRFMADSSTWNTKALDFSFGRISDNTMYFTNSPQLAQQVTTAIQPNTELKTIVPEMRGSRIFLTANLTSVFNSFAPMISLLGYSREFYESLSRMKRLNVAIGGETSKIELVFSEPIDKLVGNE